MVNNSPVPSAGAHPPRNLIAAEQRFKAFLATSGHPQNICWVKARDVVVEASHEYSVLKPKDNGLRYAKRKYVEGVAKGLGVELRAICASNELTFATIYVPADKVDAATPLDWSLPEIIMSD